MAHVGMRRPVAAEWEEGNTYKEGFVVAKAISFTGTPNKNDVKLYADDGVAETDVSIKDLGVSLNVDDLSLKVQGNLLGHEYVEAGADGSTPEQLEVGADDVAPFFGTGFYKRRKKNGVVSFTAIWLYKVQYSEPAENANTKGETTEFQTPTIEGTAYPVDIEKDGRVKSTIGKKAVFDTEGKAIAWLDKLAGITKEAT